MTKIDGMLPVRNSLARESQRRPEVSDSGGVAGRPAVEEQVQLTPSARRLQAAGRLLDELPDVDSDKVARVRAALADGSYRIRAEVIAARLLAMEGRR